MYVFFNMKRFIGIWYCKKSLLTFTQFHSPLFFRCLGAYFKSNSKTSKVRYSTSNSFVGPSFKDFLRQQQQNNVKSVDQKINTNVPYIDETELQGRGRKVLFEIYGCQMNYNDMDIVWSILHKSGYEKTALMVEADVILIMTCSIRESAESKVWEKLRALKAYKNKTGKKHLKIGILGCLAERLKNKILNIDKTVDLVVGPDSYKHLPRLLAITRIYENAVNVQLSFEETYADVMPIRLDENSVTAFVSIMRGCDNMCSYCIVPFTRGKERSRPINSILEEVKLLSDQGVKQITLLGQNVNSYRDTTSFTNFLNENKKFMKMSEGFKTVYKPREGGLRFDVLLDKVSQIDPEIRIRFTSPHPKDFPDEVLQLIKERKNICCSIHLPVQSGSNFILEKMRRGYSRESYLQLVDHIRTFLPNVRFTTDIITGFCGETEKDHEQTLDLIKLVKYNYIYYFPYSMREKTTAHRRYKDDVSQEVKIKRVKDIENVCKPIFAEINKSQINQTQLILVEGTSKNSDEFLFGRNDGNTKVIIPAKNVFESKNSNKLKAIKPGDYVAVNITEANSLLLKGVPLYHSNLSHFDEESTI